MAEHDGRHPARRRRPTTASSSWAGRKSTTGRHGAAHVTVSGALYTDAGSRRTLACPHRCGDLVPVRPRPRAARACVLVVAVAAGCSGDDRPPRRLLGPQRGPDRPAPRALRRGDRHQASTSATATPPTSPCHRRGGRPLAGRRLHLAEPRRRGLPRRARTASAELPDDVLAPVPEERPRRRRHLGRAHRAGCGCSSTTPTWCAEEDLPELGARPHRRPSYEGEGRASPRPNGSFQDFVTALRAELGDDVAAGWLEGMADNDAQTFANNVAIVERRRPRRDRRWGWSTTTTWSRRRRSRTLDRVAELHFFPGGRPRLAAPRHRGQRARHRRPGGAGRASSSSSCSPRERSSYFAEETFEYPLVDGVEPVEGVLPLDELAVTRIDLDDLGGGLRRHAVTLIDESGHRQLSVDWRPAARHGPAASAASPSWSWPAWSTAAVFAAPLAYLVAARRGRGGATLRGDVAATARWRGRSAAPSCWRSRCRWRRRSRAPALAWLTDAHRRARAARFWRVLAPAAARRPVVRRRGGARAPRSAAEGLARRAAVAAGRRVAAPTSTASAGRGSCSRSSPTPTCTCRWRPGSRRCRRRSRRAPGCSGARPVRCSAPWCCRRPSPRSGAGALLVFLYTVSDFGAVAAAALRHAHRVDLRQPAVRPATVAGARRCCSASCAARRRGRRAGGRPGAGPAVEVDPGPAARSQVPLGRWRWPAVGAAWCCRSADALARPRWRSSVRWVGPRGCGRGRRPAAGHRAGRSSASSPVTTAAVRLVAALAAVGVVLPVAYLTRPAPQPGRRRRQRRRSSAGFALPGLVDRPVADRPGRCKRRLAPPLPDAAAADRRLRRALRRPGDAGVAGRGGGGAAPARSTPPGCSGPAGPGGSAPSSCR